MDDPESRALLTGWGRATASASRVVCPGDGDAVVDAVRRFDARGGIARGLGRSYGDQATCAGGTVLDGSALDSIGSVEGSIITVGAGVSYQTLLEHIVPLGWFVPVTPGTRAVTMGGAVAADVHGKNHHRDGSLGAHVRALTLVTGDGDVRGCGPDLDPELFWATVGGLGLTGVITTVTLELVAIGSSTVLVDTHRHRDLESLLAAMTEADHTAAYSVAWVDLMTGGACRSVLTTGRFATADEAGAEARIPPGRRMLPTPPTFGGRLLRASTVRAFNEAWYRSAPEHRVGEPQSIGRFFHPLDGVRDWNRVYGPTGFVQWQMVVPDDATATLSAAVRTLSESPFPCFLAVLKRFGPANASPMSFPIRGWTLAADWPAATPGLDRVLDELDRRVADCGGRIYLAKDGRLDPELVPTMYPRLDEFRAVRARVDPTRRITSDLARRLGI